MDERAGPPFGPFGLPAGLLAAVVGLLAVAAFGLAGRDQLTLAFDPFETSAGEVVGLLLADVGWLLAATLVLARTLPSGGVWPAFRRAAIANAVLLVLAAAFVTGVAGSVPRIDAPDLVPFTAEGDPWRTRLDIPGLRYALVGLLVLLLATALGGLLLLAGMLVATRSRYFRRHRVAHEPPWGRGRRRAAGPDAMQDAIVRARRALRSTDDERRAVISAYAAMERAIAAGGVERRAAQTPAEFLHAALGQGLLRDREAAGRVLGLFELARFSHEHLPADAAATADHDLGLLLADLDQPEVTR